MGKLAAVCRLDSCSITLEGIRLAIEKVGAENVSGRAVRDALVTIRDFDTGLIPPITLTDEDPIYSAGYRIYQIQGGKILPYSDWFAPVAERE